MCCLVSAANTCGHRGSPKILRDKLGHLPPVWGTEISVFGIVIFFSEIKSPPKIYSYRGQGHLPTRQIWRKSVGRAVFSNFEFENFGGVAVFGFRPLAAPPGGKFLCRSIAVSELWKMPLTACRYLFPVRSYDDLKFSENPPNILR